MRKWMSERLKRRKSAEPKPASESSPAPLQPKYFDQDQAEARSTGVPEEDSGVSEVTPPQAEDAAPTPAVHHRPQPQNGENARPARRRRRGRGGRGRKGSVAPPARGAEPPPMPATETPATAAPATAAAPVTPAPPRTARGTVVLAIGLPGSGKSAWFKRHNITPLSSDLLRALLFDDPTEQRFQDLIFSNLRSMLKARLIARRPMNYVDATNLTPHERKNWIALARDYDYDVQAVFFDVPLEVCLERNQKRERVVPEDIMRRMSEKLRAPSFDEGFSKITVVKVKKKDNEPVAG
jgi:predicted kinase